MGNPIKHLNYFVQKNYYIYLYVSKKEFTFITYSCHYQFYTEEKIDINIDS